MEGKGKIKAMYWKWTRAKQERVLDPPLQIAFYSGIFRKHHPLKGPNDCHWLEFWEPQTNTITMRRQKKKQNNYNNLWQSVSIIVKIQSACNGKWVLTLERIHYI